jgi:hypothetical protein
MNHTGLYILPSIFYYNTTDKNSIKYCWNNKYKNRFNQTLFNELNNIYKYIFNQTYGSTDEQTKFTLGILNGRVWKSKFEEKSSNLSENSDESNNENDKIIDCDDDEKINEKTYDHLNIHSFNSCMDTVHRLFQKATKDGYHFHCEQEELIQNLIKWRIRIKDEKIELEFFKKNNANNEWDLIHTKIEDYSVFRYYNHHNYHVRIMHKIIASLLFNNNDIIILSTFGILIYHFSENNKSISLNYFYKFTLCSKYYSSDLEYYKKVFSKPTLPLPNYDSFRSNKWVSYVKDNKSSLLRYGIELLTFAIKEHKLELIYEIYKNCMTYFKEDLTNNRAFLSIITSTMSLLNEYYPEYISRYSLETIMIIDSPIYTIDHQSQNLHLYSFFQSLQIVNLSRSFLWTKYNYLISKLFIRFEMLLVGSPVIILLIIILFILFYITQVLIILLTLPLYLATLYILSKYHFVNGLYSDKICSSSFYYRIFYEIYIKISKKFKNDITVPTITFMNPYIKFINYPQDYKWFLELIRPQPSPFTKTISKDIYKTWNGEALINFKWNTFGKYYYAMIWILFIALLGCFTATATIPQKYINDDVRKQLFIASIILGFIHLSFEVHQLIYYSTKWFYNFWNIFGNYKYLIIYFIVF